MIALISAFGVLGLIGLRLFSFWQDRPKEGFKKFLIKELTRTGAEFLAILLSVTIGLNLGEVQQNRQQREQIHALLALSISEMKGSIIVNSLGLQFLEPSEEGEPISEDSFKSARDSAQCKVTTIEKILDMESVMATISPSAYSMLCTFIDSAQNDYKHLQTLDPKTQGSKIEMHLLSLNATLEVVISIVELEMCHLRGELTPEQVHEEFEKRWVYNPTQDNS